MTPNRHGSAVHEYPNELEIVTTRAFDASLNLLCPSSGGKKLKASNGKRGEGDIAGILGWTVHGGAPGAVCSLTKNEEVDKRVGYTVCWHPSCCKTGQNICGSQFVGNAGAE